MLGSSYETALAVASAGAHVVGSAAATLWCARALPLFFERPEAAAVRPETDFLWGAILGDEPILPACILGDDTLPARSMPPTSLSRYSSPARSAARAASVSRYDLFSRSEGRLSSSTPGSPVQRCTVAAS